MKYIVLVNMLHVGWVFQRKTDINRLKAWIQKVMFQKLFDDSEIPWNNTEIIELSWTEL